LENFDAVRPGSMDFHEVPPSVVTEMAPLVYSS
jgi:hypothetical protein